MPRQTKARVFSREFKEAAVLRILAGERVASVATELELRPKLLYDWWGRCDRGGAEALVAPGRPGGRPGLPQGPRRGRTSRGAESPEAARIAELERKVGQQTVELDFFARALQHIEASRPPKGGTGARASSPSSTR